MNGNCAFVVDRDSAGVTGRIYDRLRTHFGDDAIFMDIDSIPFGLDFREHITTAVDQCGVLLAVIGRHWAGETAAPRRIDDPRDFVRIEWEGRLWVGRIGQQVGPRPEAHVAVTGLRPDR